MTNKKIVNYANKLHIICFPVNINLSEIGCEIIVGKQLNKTYKNVIFSKYYFPINKKTSLLELLNFYKDNIIKIDKKLLEIWNKNKPLKIYIIKPFQFVEYCKILERLEFECIIGWE